MTTPAPIRIAIQIQQAHASYAAIREAAMRLDDMGVDVIYVWDHFYPLYGDPDGSNFECWATLASLAEVTHRAEIGPLVSCSAYRNPHLLADMARTGDHISGGRLILGIGSGWFERDFREYDFQFGDDAGRLRNLDRDLPVVRGRLGKLSPPPLRPIPILIGGGGERVTLRIAAQHADIWHCFGDPDTFARKSQVLDSWCERVGRDASAIGRSVSISDEYDGTFDRALGDGYVDAGAGHLTFKVVGPEFNRGHVRDWLVWRDEVNAGRLEASET
ncbi:MAG TPA: LLM class F420-dependent oxidoreductase [Thermomicrobiales bacterium]|nr:LLM class F420-dependent oxidoreductase [Thermomicrobiales bacterium]